MRVRLIGDSIYGNGPDGNLYLDGTALGETGARVADGSPCVSLSLPTGNRLKAADFESWFYLAPSLAISTAAIQLLNSAGTQVGTNAVTILPAQAGRIGGLETTAVEGSSSVAVQTINLVMTFTYTPVAAATLTFQVTYSGTASIITIASQNLSPGQATVTVPINVVGNPGISASGAPNVDTVTIVPFVSGLLSPVQFTGTAPTLVITGSANDILQFQFGGFAPTAFEGASIPIQKAADLAQQTLDQAKEEAAKTTPKPEEPQK